jgi:Mannosylglycerate hydrolase MGH1-like glycoside hydrolase domain
MTAERDRLAHDREPWLEWGPYLAERAWGTVREDYSPGGSAWDYLPHDHARSRAYRWNEDGLAGICDRQQQMCLALALWNGRDPILKERLFGLGGPEGNHGEDVKEYYFYLDSTPTHSYMRMLYKYPQGAFPYADLVDTNRGRGKHDPEYELLDTGVFAESRYFDVFVEYAKAAPDDVVLRVRAVNRGPEPAELHLLPTLWFRNTWSWAPGAPRPVLRRSPLDARSMVAEHATLGHYRLTCAAARLEGGHGDSGTIDPELLFTDNETNTERLFGSPNRSPWVKDAIDATVVHGRRDRVNPAKTGTKAAAHYRAMVAAGGTLTADVRLSAFRSSAAHPEPAADAGCSAVIDLRQREADEFYGTLQPASLTPDERLVQRQAFAGLLWSKQFYHFNVERWLAGDPGEPPPPPERRRGRNHAWRHFDSAEILSMPDKWEYPWFAAWDTAFHCIALALVDAEFAKEQLILLGREWFQHPNGQIPAYEWAFGDVNPPVLAWAAWRVYQIDRRQTGRGDREFLERVFHKMLLTFTWWVNRKDSEGNNVFEGGFLGMDNVGVFDRSAPLPTGGRLEQSDGTSWMAMFSLDLLTIALELAREDRAYEDIATKFFEHFLYIVAAMTDIAGEGMSLWNEEDGFFYDVLHLAPGENVPLKTRSMVGLVPLFGVTTMEPGLLTALPAFQARLEWFLTNRPDLAGLVSRWHEPGCGERSLLAVLRGHRMKCVLRRMLDESEFLSPHGVRSLSRYHAAHPFVYESGGASYEVGYEPAESSSVLFGGNSNWRGPIWFPVNYLIIEALQKFHHYYSDDFRVECPTGSGRLLSLAEIADELSSRLIRIFLRDESGRRPVFGGQAPFQSDPEWRDHVLFYEYFNGDDGAGVGASHQTGWTALVAKLIQQRGEARDRGKP